MLEDLSKLEVNTGIETEDWLDILLSLIKLLFGDEVRIPSCNHAVREVRRTCIALEDRTYHRD